MYVAFILLYVGTGKRSSFRRANSSSTYSFISLYNWLWATGNYTSFCYYGFSFTDYQVATLDQAHAAHPRARWWLKADGVDIVTGLEESVRREWNGDVDLGNGELQALHKEYLERVCTSYLLKTLWKG